MTPQEIDTKTTEILAYITTISLEERQQKLIERLNAEIQDEHIRRSMLLVIAANTQIVHDVRRMERRDKIALAVGGAVFVIGLIVIALLIPQPSDFQLFVFRLVLALAAACVGAAIPGSLEVNGTVKQITLRAGGAIALFVIIYLMNPPALAHQGH
jgi:hypothetical protein